MQEEFEIENIDEYELDYDLSGMPESQNRTPYLGKVYEGRITMFL